MRGKYGVTMTIEHAPKKKYNHECKECVYLFLNWGTKYPYFCKAKQKGRHYTSKVLCKTFKPKGEKEC